MPLGAPANRQRVAVDDIAQRNGAPGPIREEGTQTEQERPNDEREELGEAGVMAYLPSKKIAIALGVTYDEAAFSESGEYRNSATDLFTALGAYLAPNDPPPGRL